MEIFDWSVIGTKGGKGKFVLEFDVSKHDEDKIRYLVNVAIKTIQDKLKKERQDA